MSVVLVCKNTFLSVQVQEPPELVRAQTSPTAVPSSSSSLSSRLSIATSEESERPAGDLHAPVTCMLRNLPNKYDADSVLAVIDKAGFAGKYDFVYVPIDWRNLCNVGYMFCNFRKHEDAVQFMTAFAGYRFASVNSRKVCDVCWANVQGLANNIEHYRSSPILEKYRPLLFSPEGTRLPFPAPDPEVEQALKAREVEQRNSNFARSPEYSQTPSKGPDTHKIFVGGLSKSSTAASLKIYFSRFAQVKDVSVVADRTSGKSRGFAFVLFDRLVPPHVLSQTHTLDGAVLAVKPYTSCM